MLREIFNTKEVYKRWSLVVGINICLKEINAQAVIQNSTVQALEIVNVRKSYCTIEL